MEFASFYVHYEQRTPTMTDNGKVTFNATYIPVKMKEQLRFKLANVSIPAARRVYNHDPDHQSGFEDTES